MRRFKRLAAMAITAALAVSLLVLPAGAVQSSFGDVTDQNTAVNADILRLMGVVSGTGGNLFDPGAVLSRAQFCTMVINFMQEEDKIPLHNTRTIFSDVTGSHWARGYVNLAASLTRKDGEREIPLVSGVGNGQFRPDDPITLAQATTILIRVLGYTSEQAGSVWPQSYMDLAGSIGLLDGLGGDYLAPLTRAQAAQLFVNALGSKTGGENGAKFYTTLGTEEKENLLLAVDVESDTGAEKGAIRTSSGTYLPRKEGVKPSALTGKRGSLILNEKKEIVTFLPDDSESTVITLSENAQPGALKARGKQYTIDSDTMVYTTDSAAGKSYLDSYSTLYSGTQLTLYTERGKVVAIYTASPTTSIEADAVVVMGRASASTFHQLTGGADSFNVIKNREQVSLSYIRPYDVVTYDELTNTLIASDLRLPCIYRDASPNTRTPKTISVHGSEFEVLESAWGTIQNFKMGDSVLLLLTADGKVAGMAGADSGLHSTAIGLIDGKSAQLFLPNGGTKTLSGVNVTDSLSNRLVTYSGGRDSLNATRLSTRTAPGAFLVGEMKLGGYDVSTGVRIFEQTGEGVVTAVTREQLGYNNVDKEDVAAYHLNSANMVDYIVLNAVTGNAYQYGMMVSYNLATSEDGSSSRTVWELRRGTGGVIDFKDTLNGYAGKNGDMVGMSVKYNSEGKAIVGPTVKLTAVEKVKASDFFQRDDLWYVTKNGRTYQVSVDVECFQDRGGDRRSQDIWFNQATGADRLSSCLAYSDNLTLYVDSVGQQVRIIGAK